MHSRSLTKADKESRGDSCPVCCTAIAAIAARDRDQVVKLGKWSLASCTHCGHTFCPAAFDVDVDYESLYGSSYADQQSSRMNDVRRHPRFLLLPPYRKFIAVLGRGRSRSVLDYGCGAGRFLIVSQALGWVASGYEPAAEAARRGISGGLEITSGPSGAVVNSGKRYDVITIFDVLEHLSDPMATLRMLLPMLKDGGKLFVTVPNWDCPIMQDTDNPEWLPPVHQQFFTRGSLHQLLDGVDPSLQILECGDLSSDPMPALCVRWSPATGRSRLCCFVDDWLRWYSRRLRGIPDHRAQLYALACVRR